VADASALRSPFDGRGNAASHGLIVVVAAVLAWHTWATWGDIQIDCGRELYVPVEILRGKLLYRDIFYPYGPLAPYVGALLIDIFGPHLVVLYLFGIAVAIGCAMLLLEIGTTLEGRAAGLTAALALLLMGFAPGIFNFPLPYSYGATIGVLLSVLCAWFTLRNIFDRPGPNLLMAGFAASLTLLTKQEFGIACYLMLAFVLVMEAVLQRSMRPLLRGIAACAPGILLWVAIYGWFFWTLTPAFMVDANWVGLPGTAMHAYGAHFYSLVGQRFIPREMLALTMLAAVCLMLWFVLAKARSGVRNIVLGIVIAIAVAHRFDLLSDRLDVTTTVLTALLVYPIGMFIIDGGFVGHAIYKLNQSADRRHLAEAAFGTFALVPAIRVFAAVKPYGYSIYLAVPLFLVFVVAISRCIKAATPAFSADQQRGLVNYLLGAEVVMLGLICVPTPTQRTATLQTSWGIIYVEPEEANVARKILAFIAEQKHTGRQVALLPEATMLYALGDIEAPDRWYMVVPGILSPGQEEVLLTDLNRSQPDYILITSRKTTEYGADYFGVDYDQKIYQWIESNYRIAGQFGRFRRDDSGSAMQAPLAALVYQRRNPVERNSIGTTIPNRPG
jgi:hypothetical protein